MILDIIELVDRSLGDFKQMGGKGSGNWRHRGRPGKRGGSAPGKGRGLPLALKRAMPEANRNALTFPKEGLLLGAKTRSGRPVESIAYNPKTGTLVAGGPGQTHASLIAKYSGGEPYDSFVKVQDQRRSGGNVFIALNIYLADDNADLWMQAFDVADILHKVGYSLDTPIGFTFKMKPRELTIGEIGVE